MKKEGPRITQIHAKNIPENETIIRVNSRHSLGKAAFLYGLSNRAYQFRKTWPKNIQLSAPNAR
jgi:hypothetical protein